MKCPCCDRELDPAGDVIVSLETNRLTYGGSVVRLTRRETEMLYVLWEQMPHPVPIDRIIAKVWSIDEPEDARNCVAVVICKIRAKLPPGLRIVNLYGKYMLALDATVKIINDVRAAVTRAS